MQTRLRAEPARRARPPRSRIVHTSRGGGGRPRAKGARPPMSDYPSPTGTRAMSQWDDYAERLRVQLPAAPEGLLNGYVRWAPWVAIVFGIIGLLATLAL